MAPAAAPDDDEPPALPHEQHLPGQRTHRAAQPRLHIDRKRMRELQELRIALGHQPTITKMSRHKPRPGAA
mgnify:CR=1 FL=1